MSKVNTMLESMKMRGSASETTGKTEETGEVVIGMCWTSDQPANPFQTGENAFQVLDGGFFLDESEAAPDLSGKEPLEALFETPGAFAYLGLTSRGLTAARDPLGQKPLYWGVDEDGGYGFASLRTALKSARVANPKPVLPGQIVALSKQGPTMSADHILTNPEHHEISDADALRQLEKLLLEAVSRMVPEKSGLGFSGGLDSALVASACKRVGLEPELITVGLKGQPELEHAAQAADSIGLHANFKCLSESEVVEAVPAVVRTVESNSPVTVGISVPFYFACQRAREIGVPVIVAGQLSDELFGGYAKFEELALKEGPDMVDLAMWNSVLAAAEGDFEPGDKVAVSFGLELRCPFAFLPLVNSALQLPVGLKVKMSKNGVTRKYILRRLAEKWGLPASIVNRPKRAVQYSSGVQKVLSKEARRQGRKLGELLSSLLPT